MRQLGPYNVLERPTMCRNRRPRSPMRPIPVLPFIPRIGGHMPSAPSVSLLLASSPEACEAIRLDRDAAAAPQWSVLVAVVTCR